MVHMPGPYTPVPLNPFVPLSARLFTARRGTAPTGYPCTQELKSAAPSFFMKSSMVNELVNEHRIVHARFMIEIS